MFSKRLSLPVLGCAVFSSAFFCGIDNDWSALCDKNTTFYF